MKKLNIFLFSLILSVTGLLPKMAMAQTTQVGQAVDLDGIDDDIVMSTPDGPRTEYSVQVRVKLTNSNINQGIILQTYTDVHQSWSHQIRTDDNGAFMHNVYDQGAIVGRQIHGTTIAQLNQWYDITITGKDGGFAKLYVNGVEEGTAQPLVTSWKNGSGYFAGIAGGNNNVAPGSEVYYMKGQFDEIRIWDKELTPAQINQYKNCSLIGNYAGLQRSYTFNQNIAGGDNRGGSLGYCWDQSQNNKHAYFENSALLGTTSNFVAPGGTIGNTCSLASINITGRPGFGNIQNGNTTISSYDGTDYEYVGQNYPLTKNFTVTNTGTSDLSISNVTITGPNASEFVITTPPATSLTGGQATTLGIRFTPTALGNRRATVTVTSDAVGANTFTFVIGGTGAGILPLTLTRFNAVIKQQTVALIWETVNEQATSYFEIERSTNGSDYKTIAKVNAAGNSRAIQQYSAQDANPEKGIQFYRLKIVDNDGKFTYSSIVKIDLSTTLATAVNITPNPIYTKANVSISTKATGKAVLKIISLTGQPVQQYNVTLGNGTTQISIERNTLASGTYFYTLTGNNGILANGKILFQ